MRERGHRKDQRRCKGLHCVMVDEYRWTRDSQIHAREVAAGNEDIRPVTFKRWLQGER